jgi:kynureninase
MMKPIRERSVELTGELEKLLRKSRYFIPVLDDPGKPGFTIITPDDPSLRGAQLSLLFSPVGSGVMKRVFSALESYGVMGDEREPDVIRLTPIPLYNTVEDCKQAVFYLDKAFESISL